MTEPSTPPQEPSELPAARVATVPDAAPRPPLPRQVFGRGCASTGSCSGAWRILAQRSPWRTRRNWWATGLNGPKAPVES